MVQNLSTEEKVNYEPFIVDFGQILRRNMEETKEKEEENKVNDYKMMLKKFLSNCVHEYTTMEKIDTVLKMITMHDDVGEKNLKDDILTKLKEKRENLLYFDNNTITISS